MYRQNPMYPAVCGMNMSPDGKRSVANYGHGYQDCYPENHKGFAIIPCMPFPGDEVDWIFRSGVHINWCPPTVEGQNMWSRTPPNNDFQHWQWTNHDEWIAAIHEGSNISVFGAWLVHWPSNTWCMLTDKSLRATRAAAYITKSTVGVRSPRRAMGATPPMRKIRSLEVWHDILGRRAAKGRLTTPAGVLAAPRRSGRVRVE
jgi:hypothetical protein